MNLAGVKIGLQCYPDQCLRRTSSSNQNELDSDGPGGLLAAGHDAPCQGKPKVVQGHPAEALLLVQVETFLNQIATYYLSWHRSRGPLGDCGDEFVTYNHSSQVANKNLKFSRKSENYFFRWSKNPVHQVGVSSKKRDKTPRFSVDKPHLRCLNL